MQIGTSHILETNEFHPVSSWCGILYIVQIGFVLLVCVYVCVR